jgi:hypothetical protein
MRTSLYTIISILVFLARLPAADPGEAVFAEPRIFEVRFHFDQPDFLDSLHRSHETGDYIPGNVTIDGVYYDKVGVRFKGHSSYHFYPGDKKPFRIKFNAFRDHRFDGLKKISLNNGWSDPTMLREKIHLDFLRERGIPAPRANFARVYIDSVYWGFYTLVEHVDKVFLASRYGDNDGNLYKAEKSTLEWQGNDPSAYYDDLELKTNEKENDWSRLVGFLDILNNTPDGEFRPRLEEVFNAGMYLRAWAADNLFVNQDSYLGSATNYYLYDNPLTGKFEWIVWDVNLTLAARGGRADLDLLYAISKRPLMIRMLRVEEYKQRYLDAVRAFIENYFTAENLFPQIDRLADLIRADYLADTLKMYANEQVLGAIDQETDGVPGLKPFILARRESVLGQLDSLTTGFVPVDRTDTPATAVLHQNYPNPFNPETVISWQLAVGSMVELSVYNVLGEKVATLVSKRMNPGHHTYTFNGSNLASGLYYYQLMAGEYRDFKQMILIK